MISLSALLGGAACGLLYASILIAVNCLAIFSLYRKNDPRIRSVFQNHRPSRIIFSFIVLIKPSLALLGIAFTYLLSITGTGDTPGIFGNINLVYFLAILSIALLLQAAQSILFPLGKIYPLLNLVLFVSTYGVLLPVITY